MTRQSHSNYLNSCPTKHGYRKQGTSIGNVCMRQDRRDIREDAKKLCQQDPNCKAITVGQCRG
jgi:hypothetical protein